MKIELYYDKDCPFCNSYANYIKLKENHQLKLLNARESKHQLDYFKTLGYDINDGFIIKIDETDIYQGVNAIVFLNNLTKKRVYFPDNYFFRNVIYPFIKFLRKCVLLLKGKKVDL